MPRKLQKAPKVPDYGNEQINRLAMAGEVIDQMEADERHRFFVWLKSKYSKEWPSESY